MFWNQHKISQEQLLSNILTCSKSNSVCNTVSDVEIRRSSAPGSVCLPHWDAHSYVISGCLSYVVSSQLSLEGECSCQPLYIVSKLLRIFLFMPGYFLIVLRQFIERHFIEPQFIERQFIETTVHRTTIHGTTIYRTDSSSNRQFIERAVYRTDNLSNRQFIEPTVYRSYSSSKRLIWINRCKT